MVNDISNMAHENYRYANCQETLSGRRMDIHQRINETKNDDVSPFSQMHVAKQTTSPVTLCDLHSTEEIIFYCEKCKKLICAQCLASRHNTHKVTLIKDFRKEKIDELNKFIKYLEKRKVLYNDVLDTETKTQQERTASCKQYKLDLSDQKDKVIKEFVKEVDDVYNKHVSEILIHQQKQDGQYSEFRKIILQETVDVMSVMKIVKNAIQSNDIAIMIKASMEATQTLQRKLVYPTQDRAATGFQPENINQQVVSLRKEFIDKMTVPNLQRRSQETHQCQLPRNVNVIQQRVSSPPPIYEQDSLEALFTQYEEKEDASTAHPFPDWCDESETVDDDSNMLNSPNQTNEHRSNRKETLKKDAKFMDGVKGVSQVIDQPRLFTLQKRCQKICEWRSSGFPGSQPVSMDIVNLQFLTKKAYKVSWKADGTRYMMLVDGANEVYMVDRDNTVFHVPHIQFPRRKDLDAHIKDTLLDGEIIIDQVEGVPVPRYLIYDIIRFEGKEVGKVDFRTRLVCIEKEIVGPRHVKITQGKLDNTREPFSVRIKPFWDVVASRKVLDGSFSKQVSHEVDGLVFQPIPDPYCAGRCHDVLKWKPPDQNSIDFKLKLVKEQREGMLSQTVACLYVLGLDKPLATMKYTKALKEFDGKIIECFWDGKEWKFMRQRTDKSHPNSYATACGVWESIQKAVTKEILFDIVESEQVKQLTAKRPHPGHAGEGDRNMMPPPSKAVKH